MTRRRRPPLFERPASLIAAAGLVGSCITVIAFNASANPPDARATDIRTLAYEALKSDPATSHYARGQTFRTRAVQQEKNGDRHIRMDRYYKGLPVIGGDLVLHMTGDGGLKGISQMLTSAPDFGTRPALSVEDAWTSAFKHASFRESAPGGKGKKGVARSGKDAAREARAGSRLVVWAGKKQPRLAYENVIRGVHADGTPAEVHTYVDAENGKVLGTRDRYLQEQGAGNTLYSGQVTLETNPSSRGGFELTDSTRGGMTTLDANNQCAPQDPDPNCRNGGDGGPGGDGGGGPADPGGPQDPQGDGSGPGNGGQRSGPGEGAVAAAATATGDGTAFGVGPLPVLPRDAEGYCLNRVPVCYGAGQQGRQPEEIPPPGGDNGQDGDRGQDANGGSQSADGGQDGNGGGQEGNGGGDGGGNGGDGGGQGGDNGNPLGVPGAAPVVSEDNTFGTGDAVDRATVAADVHFGASQAWDYFQETFGRNGFGGDGRGPTLYPHYGSGIVNAFADPQTFTAVFGDGDGQNVKPLTELDVVAHEMGHLVTLSNNALSEQGEPAALNESTSDIFGAMAEFFTNNPNDPPDFLLGEDLEGNAQQKQLQRFMDRPSRDGRSPDCFSPDVGRLDPHDGGGVSNHFFFLLVNGSGESEFGNSPTCDNSQVRGIGTAAAEQIWFRAVTTYFTSNTGFLNAREGTLQAATDLFGQDSIEAQTVAQAWDAVNVR
ncbi:M4 family metallopeptidase [Streptomyces luteolifulvus]|uniref:M4 family metallopeptidase n=1 Tax=Streptomyces luteolifulvus TaxID=2615112 RepID=A0A6H9UQ31_9ACTN|nr:M4 family metallopeptidase [Streptomyces luteolifulvus]KAB1140038.1 M4 family metallopeptidase [Streptomyces luteolifulvus]